MGKSYTNNIQQKEVGLAIENLLIAPFGTSWTPGRCDVASPPAGFTWLGAVKEDSAQLSVNRSKFQLKTGIPQALQFEAIMGIDGKFSIVLYSRSARKIQYALGNVAPLNIGAEVGTPTTITSIGTEGSGRNAIYVASTGVTGAWAVGDCLVNAATTPGLSNAQNEGYISAITSVASGFKVILDEGGFDTAPAASQFACKITGVRQPYGTSVLRKFALLGVADFTDGVQIVHYLPSVASGGESVEQIAAGDVIKVPLAFDMYATQTTSYGGTENILGERFYFPY